MCGRRDTGVHRAVSSLSDKYDYSLFEYANETRGLQCQRICRDNNVTIILDYSVPRKLFNELFLYCDDLPTVVSGQDNLANILYLNLLSTGRPFFWEVLIFQALAPFDILRFVRQRRGEKDADQLDRLWYLGSLSHAQAEQAEMFYAPHPYRALFKRIATAANEHPSFVPQLYYLILSQLYRSGVGFRRPEKLIAQLGSSPVTSNSWRKEILRHLALFDQYPCPLSERGADNIQAFTASLERRDMDSFSLRRILCTLKNPPYDWFRPYSEGIDSIERMASLFRDEYVYYLVVNVTQGCSIRCDICHLDAAGLVRYMPWPWVVELARIVNTLRRSGQVG
jgi:hypothetical protein